MEDVNNDLERCKKVLKENNYLEIIIAIEELQDKYRSSIKEISEANNVVWNYSKKDLENIKDYLSDYKEKLILRNKLKDINEKIAHLKSYIENNSIDNKNDLISIIEKIEDTNDEEISLNEKYNKLKSVFKEVEKFDRYIASNIFELIALVIK